MRSISIPAKAVGVADRVIAVVEPPSSGSITLAIRLGYPLDVSISPSRAIRSIRPRRRGCVASATRRAVVVPHRQVLVYISCFRAPLSHLPGTASRCTAGIGIVPVPRSGRRSVRFVPVVPVCLSPRCIGDCRTRRAPRSASAVVTCRSPVLGSHISLVRSVACAVEFGRIGTFALPTGEWFAPAWRSRFVVPRSSASVVVPGVGGRRVVYATAVVVVST